MLAFGFVISFGGFQANRFTVGLHFTIKKSHIAIILAETVIAICGIINVNADFRPSNLCTSTVHPYNTIFSQMFPFSKKKPMQFGYCTWPYCDFVNVHP